MQHSTTRVESVSWRDLCPALILFRAVPISLSLTLIALATLGVVLTPLGWIASDLIFLNDDIVSADPGLESMVAANRTPWQPFFGAAPLGVEPMVSGLQGAETVFQSMVDRVSALFTLRSGLRRYWYVVLGAVWTMAVWAFVGCAISRIALMRLTREDPVAIDDAVRFAASRSLSCFAGIGIPLLAIAGLAIPVAVGGLLLTTNFGAALAGVFWFVVMLFSLLMAVVTLGLLFAWPLIITAIACEGQDSFEGMSRAFSYVFQRPFHYLAYAIASVLLSGFCWLVVSGLVSGAIHMSWWASSWGANLRYDRIQEIRTDGTVALSVPAHRDDVPAKEQVGPSTVDNSGFRNASFAQPTPAQPTRNDAGQATENASTQTGSLTFARNAIRFWQGVLKTLGAAFLYGLFWCLASAVYLLLRKDLDNTEMDEIYVVDQRRTYELPPLKEQANGVPAVDETASPSSGVDGKPSDEPDVE